LKIENVFTQFIFCIYKREKSKKLTYKNQTIMKKFFLIILSLCFTILMQAQVYKTATVSAGGLSSTLTPTELSTVTNLTLLGTIDARDFTTMRDNMPALAVIDISGTTIAAYSGTPANEVPSNAFQSKTSLTSVIFPSTITSIGNSAFYQCSSLTSVTIPSLVTSIGTYAFIYCTGLTSVNFSAPSSLTTIGIGAFYQCGLTSVTIPSSVMSIGASAFYNCTHLTSVDFSAPSSLTSIGNNAFVYCTGLTSVNFSATSSLTSIGFSAFNGCTHLTSVNIPSSVTLIEYYAFYGCTGLTSVNFSATSPITSIEYGVFWNCTGLTSVNIPSSVTSIEAYSFYNCTHLTSVTIPPSVTSIKTYAFANCTGLSSFYAQLETPVNLSSFPSVFSGVNKSSCILHVPYGSSALYAVADQWNDFTNKVEMAEFKVSATKARIESTVGSSASIGLTTALSWTAISNQSWLTVSPLSGSNNATLVLTAVENTSYSPRFAKVTVSAAGVPTQSIFITQLGVLMTVNNTAGGLFAALTAAQRSQITRLTVTGTIDARDFKTMRDDMPLLAEIDISGAMIAAYTGTEGTYPSATYPVNTIPQYAFNNSSSGVSKTSLTSIILPSTATSIDTHAFYRCSGLSYISIPSSVTSIGYQAFYQCNKLTSVTIPSSVTSIEHYAFQECIGLTSVNFSVPSSLTSMGTGAFIYCSGLTSVTIPSSLTTIPIHAFYQCTGLTSVNIPSSVTSIEEAAFYQCGLTLLNIPSSVTSIGQSAFSSCTGLTSVNIPSSVTSIGANAFSWCSGLTSFTFSAPSSLTSIGGAAFYYCTKLESVILPESVTSIGRGAFESCTVLSKVSIPSTVTSIGEYSFYNCTGLTSIYAYPATPVNLTSYVGVFLNVNKTTCKLFVPYGTKVLYAAAEQWKDFTTILEIPTAGSIAASQTICYNTSPAMITSTSPGLVMTGAALSYRWEYSTDGIVWTSTGATNATFSPGNLTQTTNFHRITISTLDGFSWESVPTEPVTITVMTEVTAGTIGTAQTICNGTTPSPLTSTASGTGSGAISYEWQNNATGSYATIAGATSEGYSPPLLTVTTSYQRRTVSNQDGVKCYSGYTAPVTITVQSVVTAGTIGTAHTICNGMTPSPLISTTVGNGSGTISYEWQTNATGSYATIAGATTAGYTPQSLTATTSFQRRTVSVLNGVKCYSSYTTPVTITVQSVVTAGTIGTNQTICNGTTPSPLTSTAVGTGSGTISYEWQSNASGSYATISGATSEGYSPPLLTATTSYQRRTVSLLNGATCYSGYTAPVTITVQSVVTAGTIGTNQTICYGTTPSPLTSTAAGLGSGNISYEWQSNASGNYITIAGANSAGYSPSLLTATTSYQRRTVSALNGVNCYSSYTTPVTITVTPMVTINAFSPASSTRCQGAGIVNNSTTAINSTGITYSLDATTAAFAGNSINSSTGEVTYSAGWSGPTTITASADGCNGPAKATHVVTSYASPNTSAIAGKQIPGCNESGVTYSVSLTTGSSYAWTVPSGAIITAGGTGPNNNQITVSFGSTNGDISVVETNTNSCSGTTKKLSINLVGCGLNPDFTGTPLTVCQGSTVTFANTSTGTTGSTIYSWDFGTGATPATATTSGPHVVSYSTSGQKTVSLTITDGASITKTKTNYITVDSNVTIAAFSPASSTRCQGAGIVTTTTTATNNSAAIVYSLDAASLAGGNTINSSTGAVTYSAGWSGKTTITASVDGCNSPATTTHVVTTTTTLSPSVKIAVTSGSIPTCSGSSVTFTATPINGGTTPSYQWKKGSTNVGTNSATYTDDATAAGSISVVMTTSLDCATSQTATSNVIDLLVNSPGQWLGITSNWDDASNWCGGVPTSSTNVSIPSGVIQPVIGVSTSASCSNIAIANGAILNIASDATGTGSMIISGIVSGEGTAMVQRYMTTNAWHIVASPVSGQPIDDFLATNPNVAADETDARGMMDYNPALNEWNNYFTDGTNGTNKLETGKGFSMRTYADIEVTFNGKLQYGDLTVTSLTPTLWNCVGNPYSSAIAINANSTNGSDDFLNANAIASQNLDPSYSAIYVWDRPDASNGVSDEYTIISNTPVFGTDAAYDVQQGQAFMVKMNTLATSIDFNSNMQFHGPALPLKSTNGIWSIVKLNASISNQKSYTTIAFNNGMTKGLDPTYDAGLLRGGSDLVLYSKLVEDNGIPFAIQALPSDDFSNLIIPIGIESKTGGELVFSSEIMNLPSTCQLILEDKVNKTFTDLSINEYVTTLAANSSGSDRFRIHTSYVTTKLGNGALLDNLSAYAVRNVEIRVKGKVSKQAIATLYDLQGRTVLVKTLEEGSLNIIQTPNIKTAVYMLSIQDNGKTASFKIPVNE
jgi:hypothetical protein